MCKLWHIAPIGMPRERYNIGPPRHKRIMDSMSAHAIGAHAAHNAIRAHTHRACNISHMNAVRATVARTRDAPPIGKRVRTPTRMWQRHQSIAYIHIHSYVTLTYTYIRTRTCMARAHSDLLARGMVVGGGLAWAHADGHMHTLP